MTVETLVKYFDHTNLKAYAVQEDLRKLCREANEYHFASVMVNPAAVSFCRELIVKKDILIGTVVGFPLGAAVIEIKAYETEKAISQGADEIDYVINISAAKDGKYDLIKEEMQAITDICRQKKAAVKVIFENCYLKQDEIERISAIAALVRPDYIKTSTGFGTYGARVEDVEIMTKCVKDTGVKIKAAGGIRDLATCLTMIRAGAQRIGSSNSVDIVKEFISR